MDNFKLVVDKHGHLLGAKVLKEVAEVVHSHLDTEDRIVRYGGDEYIVILPGQADEDALSKVEAIRKGINSDLLSPSGRDQPQNYGLFRNSQVSK